MDQRSQRRLIALVVVLVVAAVNWYRSRSKPVPPPGGGRSAPARPAPQSLVASEQMLLGNPDDAREDPSLRTKFLMVRPEFALSYNDELRFPNWVSWRLAASDIGQTERGNFVPDPDLPSPFAAITTGDYRGTGYDRGHNCPSKDRSASRATNDVAFYMTNITPQRHEMNAGPWENLERYCRELAQQGNELYILCGHGLGRGRVQRIGKSGIAVPDFGWKIAVVLPEQDGDDRARITAQTRVIAVKVPNQGIDEHDAWEKYVSTPAEIEQATGLKFFASLDPVVADALRRKRDSGEGSFSGRQSGFGGRRRR